MLKSIALIVFGIALFAALAGLGGQASAQGPEPTAAAKTATWEDSLSSNDGAYVQVIPPADMLEVEARAQARKAHRAQERARVQAVIDYIRANHRFPPRTKPFDAAQQVVIDYIRINQRVPVSADQVSSPVQAVIDYIKVHRTMPPRSNPLDPAIQDVMDYIRIYNRVPSSAAAVQ